MTAEQTGSAIPASSVHLDAIRGAAALVVFLAHGRNMFFGNMRPAALTNVSISQAHSDAPLHAFIPPAPGFGHHAVIIFFVLSGYLVGGSVLRRLHESRWSWRWYLTQRMTRLWVVLLPALILGLCLDQAGIHGLGDGTIYSAPAGQAVIRHPAAGRLGVGTLLGNAGFLQSVAVPEFGTNVALWSLAYEFWYYMAFPLLAILCWRGTGASSRWLCLLALAALFGFVGIPIALYFLVWLLGVAVSCFPPMRRTASRMLAGAAAPAFLFASLYVRTHAWLPQYASDIALGSLFSLVLYACLQESQPMRASLYSRGSGMLSRMSYTLYVVHLPALAICSAAFAGPWRAWPHDDIHVLAFGLIAAGILIYAFGVFWVFERNTNRIRNIIEQAGRSAAPVEPEVFA